MTSQFRFIFICLIFNQTIIFSNDWKQEEIKQGKITEENAPALWKTFKKRNKQALLWEYNSTIKLALNDNLKPNLKPILEDIEEYIYRTKKFGNINKSNQMIQELEQVARKYLRQDELNSIKIAAKQKAKEPETE